MQPNPFIREDSYLSTLYFAYGANLNRTSMRERCPAAIPCGAYRLEGFRLVFRTVADIEPAPGEAVHGVLWRITPECLRSLDVFEGYPDVYDHRFLTLEDGGDALYYKMNTTGYAPPPQRYYQTLREGYDDFALPPERLTDAYAFSEAREGLVLP